MTKDAISRRKFLKTSAVGGAAAAGTTLAAPAVLAQAPITLKMQSSWPASDIFQEMAAQYVERVHAMSNNRLKIDLLPAGAVVDRSDRRRVLIVAQLLAAIAFTAAGGALLAGTLAGLAAAVFAGAIGIVLFVLTTNAIMPALVARAALAPANARLELARAIAAIAAPAIVGLLAQHRIGVG